MSHFNELELIRNDACGLLSWPGRRGELTPADSDILWEKEKMDIRKETFESLFKREKRSLLSSIWSMGLLEHFALQVSQAQSGEGLSICRALSLQLGTYMGSTLGPPSSLISVLFFQCKSFPLLVPFPFPRPIWLTYSHSFAAVKTESDFNHRTYFL